MVLFDVPGKGTPTLAFRMAADSGLFDGITRPITLVGGTTYFFSADLAAANEDGGLGNGDASTAYIKLNGQNIAVQSFGGGIGGTQIIRTNVFASFTAPTTGVYDLAVTFVDYQFKVAAAARFGRNPGELARFAAEAGDLLGLDPGPIRRNSHGRAHRTRGFDAKRFDQPSG